MVLGQLYSSFAPCDDSGRLAAYSALLEFWALSVEFLGVPARMRHYVTVDGSLYSQHGGSPLRQRAAANLSLWSVETGFGWRGVGLSGLLIPGFPNMNLKEIGDRIALGHKVEVPLTRLIISEEPIADTNLDGRFGLLVAITSGESFAWRAGSASTAATITIDPEARLHKLEATIIDLCQDIMIGNSDLIQSIVKKYCDKDGNRLSFFKEKAEFARRWHAENLGRPTRLAGFESTGYAAFSALVRGRSSRTYGLGRDRALMLAEIWKDFLTSRFSDYFLNAAEAVDFVVKGAHRRARPGWASEGGKRKKAGVARGDLARSDLHALFSDPQVVTHDGCYVLCISERQTPKRIGKHAALFGWKNPSKKTVRKLKLLQHSDYAKAIELVRDGQVTPIVLFLKKPS